MARTELYHVGIVVPDLDEAKERFSALLGLSWGPVIGSEIEVRDEKGLDAVAHTRICFSTEAPHIELIQETPGTPWVCNEHSNLHHIGFFSDDVAGDSAALTTAVCPFEYGSRPGSEPAEGWAYHRDALGVRLEYVGASARPLMEDVFFKLAPPA